MVGSKVRVLILALFSVLLALLAGAPPLASAFTSPVPRPTLDPAWVCQQLDNCPQPVQPAHAPHRSQRRRSTVILLPLPASTPEPYLFRLP